VPCLFKIAHWELILRDHVIKLLAGVIRRQGRPPKIIHPLDQHYQNLREELYKAFDALGLALA
jgi:hypothetical protein